MALVETWFVKNNYNLKLTIGDILVPYTLSPGETKDLISIGNTSENITASTSLRNYNRNITSAGLPFVSSDYDHTHDEFSFLTHTHEGLDVLTGGVDSDADSLHTHDGLTTVLDVNNIISEHDFSEFVRKDGSVNQLLDITSTGDLIENAVTKAHNEEHTILDHIDDVDPYTIVNYKKLVDGSNADALHIHDIAGLVVAHNDLAGLQGGLSDPLGDFDEYYHLTESQHNTLTNGINADALHIHSIKSLTISHNDIEGMQGGDPSNDEFYHISLDDVNNLNNWQRIGTVLSPYNANDSVAINNNLEINGDISLLSNTNKLYLGLNQDSSIFFDGTDLNISVGENPSLEGLIKLNDDVKISGSLTVDLNASILGDVAITGDLAVDTDTLFVDSTLGRVGVGTVAPGGELELYNSGIRMVFTENRIERWGGSGNNAVVWINWKGFDGGTTRFRDLALGDGKTKSILFIDGSAGNVGTNTTTPRRKHDILDDTNPQLRLTHTDNSVYTDFQTDASGDLTITPSGSDVIVAANLSINSNTNKLYLGLNQDASIFFDGTDLNISLDNPSIGGVIKLNDDVEILGSLEIDTGSITSASGKISFDDENLTTAGTIKASANGSILGGLEHANTAISGYSRFTDYQVQIKRFQNVTDGPILRLQKARVDGSFIGDYNIDNDNIGRIYFDSWNNGIFTPTAQIFATTNEGHSLNNLGTELEFWTTGKTTSTPSLKAVISDNDGENIGDSFRVYGSMACYDGLYLSNTSFAGTEYIKFDITFDPGVSMICAFTMADFFSSYPTKTYTFDQDVQITGSLDTTTDINGAYVLGDATLFNWGLGGSTVFNSVTTAFRNVGIGNQVLQNLISGDNNVGIGHQTCIQVTGSFNTGVGSKAVSRCLGTGNTGLGYLALRGEGNATKTYDYNVGVGYQAGYDIDTGDYNVFVGYQAGDTLTDGSYNVLIGYLAGNTLTTGDNNIIIGKDADVTGATVSDELNIGDLIKGKLTAHTDGPSVTIVGTLYVAEATAAEVDVAAYGQIWCKDNAGTTELWFTNDAGLDRQIAYV